MAVVNIDIPYNFTPRPYQKEVFDAYNDGVKRILLVWSRRAGKDKVLMNIWAKRGLQRIGNMYYVFPEYNQWRKIFRDGIDNDWFRNLDHFPDVVCKLWPWGKKGDSQKMKIDLINGSSLQVVGTDKNINSLMGTNPMHLIMSEYSIQNPLWWKLLSPIVDQNNGTAHFCYTPRGKNHGWRLLQYAKDHPEEWFVSIKKAYELYDNNGNRIITDEQLEKIREQYVADGDLALFEQEYLCSFEWDIKGAYYGEQLRQAEKEWRVCTVPYEPNLRTYTFRDLGMDDTTAIRFVQILGKEARLIDYYENNGQGLDHYAQILREKGYNYTMHYFPHDGNVRELATGISRLEYMQKIWIKNIEALQVKGVQDGIDAVRRVLKYCWFDIKTESGIDALKSYHKEYNDKLGKYNDKPQHDWTSHAADSFRYFAQKYEELVKIQGGWPSVITVDRSNYYV